MLHFGGYAEKRGFEQEQDLSKRAPYMRSYSVEFLWYCGTLQSELSVCKATRVRSSLLICIVQGHFHFVVIRVEK